VAAQAAFNMMKKNFNGRASCWDLICSPTSCIFRFTHRYTFQQWNRHKQRTQAY